MSSTEQEKSQGLDGENGLSELSALWETQTEAGGSAKRVYETLRRAILEQVLSPGRRLAEEELADALGVSRTPIREAITRLETEGIVERSSVRTVTVSRLSPKAIAEVFEVREWLDGVVAYLATQRITPPRIAELRWINERMKAAALEGDVDTVEQINHEFHDVLALAADNAFLMSLMHQARDRVRPLTGSTFAHENRSTASAKEHDQLIDLISSDDAEAAAKAARTHMKAAATVRLEMLKGQPKG